MSVDFGDTGARTGIDEDPIAFERLVVDDDRVRTDEARAAAKQIERGPFVNLRLLSVAPLLDDPVLARDHFSHVDRWIRGVDAVSARFADRGCHTPACDHCFGWRTAVIDARTAEVVAFDEGDVFSRISELVGKRVPTLSGSDDDGVVA